MKDYTNDWVCNDAWKPIALYHWFWIGNILGAWIWGILSDTYGRKPSLLWSYMVFVAGILATTFATDFVSLSASKVVLGACHRSVSLLSFLLVVEQCGKSRRMVPLFAVMTAYVGVCATSPWAVHVLNNWKLFSVMPLIPVPAVLITYFFVSESPGWLLQKNRPAEALQVLRRIARSNRRHLSAVSETTVITASAATEATSLSRTTRSISIPTSQHSLFDLLRTPNVRCNTIKLFTIWLFVSFIFLGQTSNTMQLSPSLRSSYFLTHLAAFPCCVLPFLYNRIGRVAPLVACTTLVSVTCLLNATLPAVFSTAHWVLALLGKAAAAGSYFTMILLWPELMPTVLRGHSLALLETAGGFAIVIGHVISCLGEGFAEIVLIVQGTLSLVCAALALSLPETSGKAVPQSLADAETLKGMTACRRTNTEDRKAQSKNYRLVHMQVVAVFSEEPSASADRCIPSEQLELQLMNMNKN